MTVRVPSAVCLESVACILLQGITLFSGIIFARLSIVSRLRLSALLTIGICSVIACVFGACVTCVTFVSLVEADWEVKRSNVARRALAMSFALFLIGM